MRHHIQTIPVIRDSDIWNFRLYGTFLAGPERNGISYNKIFRLYGMNFGYTEWILRSLRPVYEAVEVSFEAVDAVGGLVDAVEAAGSIYRAGPTDGCPDASSVSAEYRAGRRVIR